MSDTDTTVAERCRICGGETSEDDPGFAVCAICIGLVCGDCMSRAVVGDTLLTICNPCHAARWPGEPLPVAPKEPRP